MLNRNRVTPEVYTALAQVLDGHSLDRDQAMILAGATGPDLNALAMVADELRWRQRGDRVTYVVNRNINFTNVCIKHCGFCAFSRDHRQEQAYYLADEEIFRRIDEAVRYGATEICVQAGLPPKMEGDLYIQMTRKLKSRYPQLHLHAFSPEEVLYGANRSKVSVADYLGELKRAGLDTLPGTSAEILVQEVRDRIAPGRISVDKWLEVIRAAHRLGLRTSSTMMFGHVETPQHWVEHLFLLRQLQRETGGFTEFVPLAFVHREAPMFSQGRGQGRPSSRAGVRPGASGVEVILVHALARVLLGDVIANVQASWVKEGLKLAQVLLHCGVNDLGGTLMNESISTAAGAAFGQLMSPAELRRCIRQTGRTPAQRTTTYDIVREFPEDEAPSDPLDAVEDAERQFGTFHTLIRDDEHRYSVQCPALHAT